MPKGVLSFGQYPTLAEFDYGNWTVITQGVQVLNVSGQLQEVSAVRPLLFYARLAHITFETLEGNVLSGRFWSGRCYQLHLRHQCHWNQYATVPSFMNQSIMITISSPQRTTFFASIHSRPAASMLVQCRTIKSIRWRITGFCSSASKPIPPFLHASDRIWIWSFTSTPCPRSRLTYP